MLGYNVAYIGNIAFEAEEGDLRDLLHNCEITKVRMHTDMVSGRFKGYAHVHFADEESLDRYGQLRFVLRAVPSHVLPFLSLHMSNWWGGKDFHAVNFSSAVLHPSRGPVKVEVPGA